MQDQETNMDLSLNDTQQLIQNSARDFVRGSCSRDLPRRGPGKRPTKAVLNVA